MGDSDEHDGKGQEQLMAVSNDCNSNSDNDFVGGGMMGEKSVVREGGSFSLNLYLPFVIRLT